MPTTTIIQKINKSNKILLMYSKLLYNPSRSRNKNSLRTTPVWPHKIKNQETKSMDKNGTLKH